MRCDNNHKPWNVPYICLRTRTAGGKKKETTATDALNSKCKSSSARNEGERAAEVGSLE